MEVEEDSRPNCTYGNQQAHHSFQAADAIERRARIAVTGNILVAMPAHAIAHDRDLLFFALSMLLVTDVPSTALAQIIINVM